MKEMTPSSPDVENLLEKAMPNGIAESYLKWNEMRKNPPKPDPATEAYCKSVIAYWKTTSEIVKDLWKI